MPRRPIRAGLAAAFLALAAPALAQAPKPLTEADAVELKAGLEAFFKATAPELSLRGPIAATVVDGANVRLAIQGIQVRREGVTVALRDLRVTVEPAPGPHLRLRWEHAPEVRIATEDGDRLGVATLVPRRAEGLWDRER